MGKWGERVDKKCDSCGAPFLVKPADVGRRFCSQQCSTANQRTIQPRPCEICGAVFKPQSHQSVGRYCSRECMVRGQRPALLRHERSVGLMEPLPWRSCLECRALIARRDSRPIACSRRCELAHQRRRQKVLHFVSVRQTNPWIEKPCAHCGAAFRSNFMAASRLYCSRRCGDASERARNPEARAEQRHRRRARLRGARAEKVDTRAIYERDRWRCRICHRKVRPALRYPHPMSATIDHVIPLAHGGGHTAANVQLAHLTCNVRRSHVGAGQPRLIA